MCTFAACFDNTNTFYCFIENYCRPSFPFLEAKEFDFIEPSSVWQFKDIKCK